MGPYGRCRVVKAGECLNPQTSCKLCLFLRSPLCGEPKIMLQLSGQHGQKGHNMHCTAGQPLFRDIIIVCLCWDPAGAHVTMFLCRDIVLKLLEAYGS